MVGNFDIDPKVVEVMHLQMLLDQYQDYGARFLTAGKFKHSKQEFNNGFAVHLSPENNGLSFGKRIANNLKDGKWELPDTVASLSVAMNPELFRRINFEKYLLDYCSKGGATLLEWDRAEPKAFPMVGKITLGNLNPKEFIALLAAALKENATKLGTRYSSFDIPALEAIPEIKGFMQNHMSRSL